MKSFALLLVCFQACLVQNVFGQAIPCLGAAPIAYGPGIMGPGPYADCGLGVEVIAPGIAGPLSGIAGPLSGIAGPLSGIAGPLSGIAGPLSGIAGPLAAAYGGSGIGDVAVAGEMPVAGTTLVAGQVPILGAVRFAGDLPAAGTVTITGSCGCGCNRGPYFY